MQSASHFGCRSDAGLAPVMPGSLHSCAPCTRNCSASRVLPEPGPPTSSVVRPRGKPPPVISSKPVMPVGALVGTFTSGDRTDFILFPVGSDFVQVGQTGLQEVKELAHIDDRNDLAAQVDDAEHECQRARQGVMSTMRTTRSTAASASP